MLPQYPLLGLLTRGDNHGYELKRIVDEEFAPYWRIDFAQLYRSLAALTRAGSVQARLERGAEGPSRKVYKLTARGRAEFNRWLAEPTQDRAEFFVKLRMAADSGMPIAGLLEQQRKAFEIERESRSQQQYAAQETGNIARFVAAHAALNETEGVLAALDLWGSAASRSPEVASSGAETPLVITGSDDPLLSRLALLAHTSSHAVGSLGGLLALAQHQANIAGSHLLDLETGEYNVPFVKKLIPEEDVILVNLAVRENGLILARGNPKNIRGVRDLKKRGIRLINRAQGTGTRLLLYSKLREARINPRLLNGWDRIAATHNAIGGAIASGAADVGPGLRATAVAWGLDFIPLGEEQYDLVIPRAQYESPSLQLLLDGLHSAEFRQLAGTFAGYDLARMGQVVARVK